MIGNSIFGLQFHDVALPKFYLQFGKDFENVKLKQSIFNVSALGVEYKFENEKDIVILEDGKEIKLSETSSAIQAKIELAANRIAVHIVCNLSTKANQKKEDIVEDFINKYSITPKFYTKA